MKAGWEVRSLDEVAGQTLGKMLDKSKNRGTLRPYLRNLNVRWFDFDLTDVQEMRFEDHELDRYSARKGDLVICEGGYPGRAAIWPNEEPIFLQKALHRVRFNEPERANWFLYYLMLREADGSLKSHFTGTGIQHFTGQSLRRVRFPLPPLAEQQRIVSILNEAFEGIDTAVENAEKNLANARELFDSYLNSVFIQKGESWIGKRLEDTVEKTCSLSYGIVQPGEDVNGGLPIVRPTDLHSKIIGLSGLKRIDPALADGYKRTKLHGGELLLCVRGGTGSVSIAAKELAGSNVTRGIVPIRFDASVVVQEFGYFAFISKGVQDQIRAATYGAALMQINIRDLRKVSLDLPPLDVQKNLLERLDDISAEVERLVSIYEQKAAALAELKQAILHKAFAGELTAKPEKALQDAAA